MLMKLGLWHNCCCGCSGWQALPSELISHEMAVEVGMNGDFIIEHPNGSCCCYCRQLKPSVLAIFCYTSTTLRQRFASLLGMFLDMHGWFLFLFSFLHWFSRMGGETRQARLLQSMHVEHAKVMKRVFKTGLTS